MVLLRQTGDTDHQPPVWFCIYISIYLVLFNCLNPGYGRYPISLCGHLEREPRYLFTCGSSVHTHRQNPEAQCKQVLKKGYRLGDKIKARSPCSGLTEVIFSCLLSQSMP